MNGRLTPRQTGAAGVANAPITVHNAPMSPLAWLLGLFLPACGASGAAGLPAPVLLDFAHLERPATPNTALAAPAGFSPAPDLVTPVYPVSPDRLYAAIRAVAAAQTRTFPSAAYPGQLQADWVARSLVFNFPDLVTAQVSPGPARPGASRPAPEAAPNAAPGPAATPAAVPAPAAPAAAEPPEAIKTATLVLYSRSVYGYGDFGANRKRLAAWLAALQSSLHPASER